jgi:glycosyltransferase involved in cell wall biosynthesis
MTYPLKYSFVVPIYNDAYLAADFCQEYQKTFEQYLGVSPIHQQVELIFVNDGSSDNSISVLKKLPAVYSFVKVIDLSRNFGQHIAIACGFREAKGQFVGRMNVDMQDPPGEIPKLLNVIQNEDVDLVVGKYDLRYSSAFNRYTARIFFLFFNWLTGQNTPQNSAPLRIMNRTFLDAYNQLNEKSRFPQGLENWLGFKHKYIRTAHQPRIDNRSSYNFKKRLKLAFEGAISFSDRPLRIMVYTGFIITAIGFGFVILVIIQKFIYNSIIPGYTSIISIVTFLAGLQILVIGITGLYIGKILLEVQNRPVYLIREKINFKE